MHTYTHTESLLERLVVYVTPLVLSLLHISHEQLFHSLLFISSSIPLTKLDFHHLKNDWLFFRKHFLLIHTTILFSFFFTLDCWHKFKNIYFKNTNAANNAKILINFNPTALPFPEHSSTYHNIFLFGCSVT